MHFLGSKWPTNAFAAGTPPRVPLGELAALPRPLAGLRSPTSKGRGTERGGERAGKEGGECLTSAGGIKGHGRAHRLAHHNSPLPQLGAGHGNVESHELT